MDHIRWAWVRWTLGVVVAICVSVVFSVYIMRDNLINGCIRNGDFKIAVVHSSGDDSLKRAIRRTIPVVPEDHSPQRGEDPRARARGCAKAYPPPIPFIE